MDREREREPLPFTTMGERRKRRSEEDPSSECNDQISDIRKWFMKQPHKNNVAEAETPKGDLGLEGATTGRVKVSKYFSSTTPGRNVETKLDESENPSSGKRKKQRLDANEGNASEVKGPSPKKPQKDNIRQAHEMESKNQSIKISKKKQSKQGIESETNEAFQTPGKKAASISGGGSKGSALANSGAAGGRAVSENMNESLPQPGSRGGDGGRGSSSGGNRGRGGGRGGGYPNFGDRGPPPHKGQKEVPEGAEDCLAGLTFVISGTLDSLEREEAEDLIKRHGGRITAAVSKKTSYLLADEDIGGRKSEKAKELGIPFLSEDGLFDMIRASKLTKLPTKEDALNKVQKDTHIPLPKPPDGDNSWEMEGQANQVKIRKASVGKMSAKGMQLEASHSKRTVNSNVGDTKMWTEKYRPKALSDIIGNQSIVKQLHDWLVHWDEQHLRTGEKGGKGNKRGAASGNTAKRAVLISGPPGVGKTTAAKLTSQMLGLEAIEVNASDNRGKADSKIVRGINGSTANSVKEMVSNAALSYTDGAKRRKKFVLIMDEVDGMSGGDRGGVSDLIDSIKISKIPIICICNDRYSQKLKSLVNYCLPLNFRKPTKQQMAKRLLEIANLEGIQINEAALEELCERVSGDMRMALNQLQYMSISSTTFKYADIKACLSGGAKDEDVTPFTAVDKLLGYEGGRLRMDERLDFSMNDPDLVPLLIQENYLNYRPSAASRDVNGTLRMDLVARAAESIADGDIINVQIRKYRQWQLSQTGAFASSIIPAAFMHGSREVLVQGERNFNRFTGWLGKNSTWGKNVRLLEDVHVHLLASRVCEPTRVDLRLDIFPVLLLRLTSPLRKLPKEDAVRNVVELMDQYSLSQEDFDTIIVMSKLQGHPDPLEGVQPAVKAALTKAYKQNENSCRVRSADLLPPIALPGQKKAPKKRAALNFTAVEDEYLMGDKEDAGAEDAEDSAGEDDLEAAAFGDEGPRLSIGDSKLKGVEVQLDLGNQGKSKVKTSKATRSKTSTEKAKTPTGTTGVKRKRENICTTKWAKNFEVEDVRGSFIPLFMRTRVVG